MTLSEIVWIASIWLLIGLVIIDIAKRKANKIKPSMEIPYIPVDYKVIELYATKEITERMMVMERYDTPASFSIFNIAKKELYEELANEVSKHIVLEDHRLNNGNIRLYGRIKIAVRNEC